MPFSVGFRQGSPHTHAQPCARRAHSWNIAVPTQKRDNPRQPVCSSLFPSHFLARERGREERGQCHRVELEAGSCLWRGVGVGGDDNHGPVSLALLPQAQGLVFGSLLCH